MVNLEVIWRPKDWKYQYKISKYQKQQYLGQKLDRVEIIVSTELRPSIATQGSSNSIWLIRSKDRPIWCC